MNSAQLKMSLGIGRTTAMGYGHSHQRRRKSLEPIVQAGAVLCARCGKVIESGSEWDFGHVDGDKSRYSGPEHRALQPGDQRKAQADLEALVERRDLAAS